ncbi:M23 family metallopeptidase [Microbacterium sp. Leaf179]|uniref:M23 family metallopeptidase n=1 Tax=Microbacterium sp. Leaf179 TaxID=1736288 RepID=UPI0006F28BAE|nr:M23 family metallopeptidase [Microbacterium sp. Leaf179]KQR86403.1 hypothetical protein ASF96_08445 [Microbacterium sp. Leaf179]
MFTGTAILTVAGITGAPLLVALAPAPVFAVASPKAAADTQSLTTADEIVLPELVRGDYAAEATSPPGTEPYAHLANTFTSAPTSPVQWPFAVGVPISSPFGFRSPPCPTCSNYHAGLDLTPGMGTPIQAIADGVVIIATEEGGAYGSYVVIQHEIDGQLVQSAYAHMLEQSLALQPGEKVRVGQVVGRVGNSGRSFGAHLHFEIRVAGTAVDPLAWLTERVKS